MPSITEIVTPSPKAPTAPLSVVERAKAAKDAGNDHFKRKEWAEAVGCYSQAHLLDPTSPIYPLNRAQAYLNLLKFEDAERDCTRSIELEKSNSKAWFRRAVARRELRDFEAAARDLFQVVKLDIKQEGPVKAEMEKLRKEQAAFQARKGKGPAVPARPAAPAAPSPAPAKPIPIPIKMVFPTRAAQPTAAPSPASTPVSAPTFNPTSSSPLPEILAVPKPPSPAPSPSASKAAPASMSTALPSPPPEYEPASSTLLGNKVAVHTVPERSTSALVDTGDDNDVEDAPRGLLSSSGGVDPATSIFGSLSSQSTPTTPSRTASSTPSHAPPPTALPPSRPFALPTSAYSLQTTLAPKTPADRLALLLALPPARIPQILGSSLEAALLDLLLSALESDAVDGLHPDARAELVRGLEGSKRWTMVLMMAPGGRARWSAFKARS